MNSWTIGASVMYWAGGDDKAMRDFDEHLMKTVFGGTYAAGWLGNTLPEGVAAGHMKDLRGNVVDIDDRWIDDNTGGFLFYVEMEKDEPAWWRRRMQEMFPGLELYFRCMRVMDGERSFTTNDRDGVLGGVWYVDDDDYGTQSFMTEDEAVDEFVWRMRNFGMEMDEVPRTAGQCMELSRKVFGGEVVVAKGTLTD